MNKQNSGDGTVGKALDVLDIVADCGRPVRFSEILEQAGLPRATLHRFLQTLTNQRMLSFDHGTQTYTLGLRLVRLAHTAWKQSTLASAARPFLKSLAEELGETVHLAQIDSGQVLFVDKQRASKRVHTLAQIGQVAPGYCTGVGKAILAFLPEAAREQALRMQAFFPYTENTHISQDSLLEELAEIRADGVAFDREEHEKGIISIAAPILASNGQVLGAMSVATATSLRSLADLETFRPRLVDTAARIGAAAEAWQFPSDI